MNEILQRFKDAKILVIGDVMLDEYVIGKAGRISAEAPVPILEVKEVDYKPGGAGNVAANIASLGGKVVLYGAIGKDFAGNQLKDNLKEKGVDFHPTYSGKTSQKTRCIGDRGHQLLRVDDEEIFPRTIQDINFKNQEVIVISDYGKGVITKELFDQLSTNIRILIDPKPQNKDIYPDCFLMTPNEQEALQMANISDISEAGKYLRDRYNSSIIITRGEKGMIFFPSKSSKEKIREVSTTAKEVYDVTGAGDTAIATMALALVSDASPEQILTLANHAAGIVVQKQGTATVKLSELEEILSKGE